ncbi:Cyclophilin-type peptidyl-prolyl cis-trans isomerase domain [Trinorchestia longiramus]|nr:Cyclophilin-type peptidyl-prolyl cis-trans isomerase domain [Trinorchestia longiramus]
MACEEEGVRAMKGLYKYLLNGKEMVVQPAINPKKASVTGHFPSKKRAAIGRGVSTLDGFDEEGFSYDLDHEIAQCIDSDSLGSTHSSPTAQYNQYPGSTSSHSVVQLSGLGDTLSVADVEGSVPCIGVSGVPTHNGGGQACNGIVGGIGNVLPSGIIGSSVHSGSVGIIPGSAESNILQLATLANCTIASQGSTNLWADLDAAKSNGILHNNSSSPVVQSNRANSSFLPQNNNKSIALSQNLGDPIRCNQGKSALNSNNELLQWLAKAQVLTVQINQARALLQTHPTNSQLPVYISRLQHEITQIQAHVFALSNPSTFFEDQQQFILKLKQKQVPDSEIQNLLLQRQQQSQLNANAAAGGGALGDDLQQRGLYVNNTNIRPSGLAVNAFPNKIANSPTLSNGLCTTTGSNSFMMNSTNTTIANTNASGQHRCPVCHEAFNLSNRLPKILGCTHTFCLSCLNVSVSPSGVLQCPGGCGVPTQLSEAGPAGLTTNQGVINVQDTLSSSAINGSSNVQPTEVCASCTGTQQDQPLSKCRQEGHTLLATEEAVRLMVGQLRPNVDRILTVLREMMKLRCTIKERVESTLQSLAKFMEELKTKLHQDAVEEGVLISTLNDLNALMINMDNQSYPELLRTFQSVERCAKDIGTQYNQCYISSVVNEAVEALVLRLHSKSLASVHKLGLNQNEVFRMDQSLQEHALSGNYANVLLQYMVADMLGSRLKQNKSFAALNNSESADVDGFHGDARPAGSLSPADTGITSNGVMSSSGTPDMAAMNGHGVDTITNTMDQVDISCLLQTTEAIEAENQPAADIARFDDHSASLGLSSICHLANDSETIETVDLEKSLLEGSASIEPEPPKDESSAPSPRSCNSVTPPIGATTSRSTDTPTTSDSGSKPFSYLDAAKKPAKPQPEPQPKTDVSKLPAQIKQIKTPHCWMKVTVDGQPIGRIVFQLRPDKAPKMCENFLGLCTNKPGYGYKGTHFFKNGDGFLAGGDVEFDDGSGGYSIFGSAKFEADLCPLKDEVGMIRFKGNGTSENGRGMVGSQFMVWYAEREFKKFSFSLVFGRVVDGMDVVKKAAAVNLSKHDVMIEDCGGVL